MNAGFDVAPTTFPTPWAARAFAIITAVSQAGWFELRDFQQALIRSIQARESTGGCIGDEAAYYDCWVEALTSLVREKGVSPGHFSEVEDAIHRRIALLKDDQRHHHNHGHGYDHGHGQDVRDAPRPIFVEAAQ